MDPRCTGFHARLRGMHCASHREMGMRTGLVKIDITKNTCQHSLESCFSRTVRQKMSLTASPSNPHPTLLALFLLRCLFQCGQTRVCCVCVGLLTTNLCKRSVGVLILKRSAEILAQAILAQALAQDLQAQATLKSLICMCA